jgi:hypothetical protein
LLILLLVLVPSRWSFGQTAASDIQGVRGETVVPRSVSVAAVPRVIGPVVGPPRELPQGEVPMGRAVFEAFKLGVPAVRAADLTQVTIDRGPSGFAPLAPVAGIGFEGITQNGFIPSEPTSAAGPNQVFSPGNVSVTITDKDGSNRVEIDGFTFFGIPTSEGAFSDPVCHYDALRGRFVALCFTQGSSGSNKWSFFYLAISQTSDARGSWWIYKFDQRLDGSTLTSNWSDFEGLGLSDDKLAMSSQQFSFKGGAYQYQKIRVIDRALAYTGQPVGYVDFVNFSAPLGGDVSSLFVTKVGIDLGAGENTIHCLTSRYNGGTTVAYRTITGPPATPTLSAGSLVPVNAYSPPVNAAQLGSNQLVATNDCRIAAFYVRNGVLTATWHFGVNFGSGTVDAVRLFQMRTSDRAVLSDETFGADGIFYYYPAAIVDTMGTVFIGFDRSSASEFPSAYASGRRRSDSSIEPSLLLKAGLSATSQSRWGDYTGIDMDESASGPAGSSAWYAGQWTKATNTFGTWVNQITFTYGGIAGTVYDDCDGSAATTADRVPLAGANLALMQGSTTLATGTTDGSGAYRFGFLESGAYDVVVTPPAGGVAADAIPGSGGTAQTRVSASDIGVSLTSSQTSSGNLFLVTTSHPAPATAGISPDTKHAGDPDFTLAVDGSGFLPCSIVRLDGGDQPTTYVDASHLTAAIPASDVVTAGTRQITVFDPGPGGGVSNAQTLTVSSTVGVADEPVTEFALDPPAPNPVRNTARLGFALPRESEVRLSILDLQGRELVVLAAGAYPPGRHEVAWSGTTGRGLAQSGLYFVRLRTPSRTFVRRIALVR